jgi:hypothetical protein
LPLAFKITDLSTIVEVGDTKNPDIIPATISNFIGTFSKDIFLGYYFLMVFEG